MIEPKKSKNALNKKQNKTQNCDNKTNKKKLIMDIKPNIGSKIG